MISRGSRSKSSKNDQESGVDKNRGNDDSVVEVVTKGEGAKKSAQDCTCQLCDNPDNSQMVQCDECDKWSHFVCVGVTEEVENQSWVCYKCQSAKETQQQQSTSSHRKGVVSSKVSVIEERLQSPKSPSVNSAKQREQRKDVPKVVVTSASGEPSVKSIQASQQPASSKASSQSRLKLQLMKLEEERAFEEAQAKKFRDYLKEKYDLLEQMSNRTSSNQSESSSRVRKWVDEVNDQPVDENILEGSAKQFNPRSHSTTNFGASSSNHPIQAERNRAASIHRSEAAFAEEQAILQDARRVLNTGHSLNPPRVRSSPPLCDVREFTIAGSQANEHSVALQGSRDPNRSRHQAIVQQNGAAFQSPPNQHRPRQQAVTYHNSSSQPRPPPFGYRPSGFQEPSRNTLNTFLPSQCQLAARQAVSKDLPPFSGNPEDWPIFISTFESSTTMCGYSDEENMIRLQKCLKGKAYEAVKSCMMHPTNVAVVINTLRMLYGQPEAIIHSLIVKINAIPIIKEDKLEALVDLAVKVQNFCATVDACGLEDYMYNVSLLHQLVNKLPPTLKLEWARYRLSLPRVNLATFGQWVFSLAEAASVLAIPPVTQLGDPPKSRTYSSKKTSTFLHTHSESTPENVRETPKEKTSGESTSRKITNGNDNCPMCKARCKSAASCKRFLQLSRDAKWAAVREFGLCRRCLRQHEGRCDSKPCGRNGCTFYHHELLHNDKKVTPASSNPAATSAPEVQAGPSTAHGCNTHQSATNAVLFRYLPVILHGTGGAVRTYAFLDEGSAVTLLDEDLADQLNLEAPINPLRLRWTGGTERNEKNSRIVDLKITGTQNVAKEYQLKGVRTVKELMLPCQSLNMEEIAQQYPHCQNLPIDSYSDVRPRILIGLKHAPVSLILKSKEGSLEQPIAVKTRLGWTICGGFGSCSDVSNFTHYTFHVCECSTQSDEDVHQMVKEYFSMDSLGILKTIKDPLSTDDQRAVSLLQSLTKFNGHRYETGLLWRYDGVRLPDSKEMALRRFHGLERRMQKDPELANALQQKMSEYLVKGYVRKLSKEELSRNYPRVWYLPIFPVFHPNKPGKIRIVWDGAAKVFGVSLNSTLLVGPDQLCSLFAILTQFREYRVGVTGDIREMFHQILMRAEDQHCLRFFWKDDAGEIQVYLMTVMSFGASCSPASAQYVKNINADRFAGEFPEAADIIKKRHYVDDAMFSTETSEQATRLAQEVRQVHATGGFEIRNWVSNSSDVLAALNETNTAEKNLDLSMGPAATEKVLGMWWCTTNDEFVYKIGWNRFNPDLLTGQRKPTKRQMLQILMTIFDPLGLISHFLMYLKVLLQEVWRAGVQWDEEIEESLFEKWVRWLKVLPQVESVRIPRCFRSTAIPSDCKAHLHTFVDASENGFAAAVFLRFEHHGVIWCSLVAAKTRVAPLKFHSIPRLELQAALIGARLARTVTESLATKIHREFFWTDSRDVLSWISSDHRRYSVFVAFRVSEILDTTEAANWRWVPSKQNVADDGTKWETQPDLTPESRWFRGPHFLYCRETEWPETPSKPKHTENELRSCFLAHHSPPPDSVITVSNFSSWKHLINVTAYIHRFIENCRRKISQNPTEGGPLTREELHAAEGSLFRIAQQEGYADEVAILTNSHQEASARTLPKSSSLYKLSPWMDNRGVMRMHSRINACQYATDEAKNPVILPNDHPVTTLLITHYHEKFHHQNHATIVNELRQRFVIPRLRVRYATVRKNCQRCKNESVVPQPPIMADLPATRLAAYTRPFTHVGVDYFGPMEVAIGRRTEKRWGMIVICLTTRAIHVELVNSLSTNSCIIALRNFMGRRGTPRTIRSDRGTNFIGASRELKKIHEVINYEQVLKEFVTPETSWSFNPPLAPHMGGSWERLIRSLKNNLKVICPLRKPSEEVLRSLLIEVENTLNSRPLTHVPIDDESSPALTPNHLLLGSSDGSKPFTSLDDSGALLKQSWRTSQALANQFWKRWLSDYLPEITRRTKWFVDTKPIALDDVVIIVDSNLPRNSWPKGRVIAVHPSKDGRIRSATVRTSNGVYDRPVTKLATLDVRCGKEQAGQTSGLPGGSVGHP